jgi:hypothetical protein
VALLAAAPAVEAGAQSGGRSGCRPAAAAPRSGPSGRGRTERGTALNLFQHVRWSERATGDLSDVAAHSRIRIAA